MKRLKQFWNWLNEPLDWLPSRKRGLKFTPILDTELEEIFNELEAKAYGISSHQYHVKEANQIIRKHVEAIIKERRNAVFRTISCVQTIIPHSEDRRKCIKEMKRELTEKPLKIEWEFESWAEKAVQEANIIGQDEQGNKYDAIGMIGVDREIEEVKDVTEHVHDWKTESNSVMGISRKCRTCGEFNG